MLDGLDDVDWKSLKHAYGDATDVPRLIRALASTDQDVRNATLYELFGNIYHQGTVYEATAFAVPFLYELLESPDVVDKSPIACLLASIADGAGYLEVHAVGEWGETSWRKILREQKKTLEDELAREAAVTADVHRAASAKLHLVTPYLADPEPATREAIAKALSQYPEHGAYSLIAMQAVLPGETNDEVREALTQSIKRLASSNAG